MIQVQRLGFIYPKAVKPALSAIEFQVKEGEIFGFLGPSGAGKTTTQKIIIGLLGNYSGSVKIFGKERCEMGRDFFEHIGVAFEMPNLYQKLTAYENLKLFASYYQNRPRSFDELLDQVGLLADRNQKVENFSKGMKMRLNLIRSLMHQPEVLFLDEPTTGLDPVNSKKVMDIVRDLKRAGRTVLITTHNMNVADELCDRVAFIVDGRIRLIDSPGELKLKYGKRRVDVEYREAGEERKASFHLDGLGDNPDFIDLIQNRYILWIHSQEATLDEIFIKVTGRELI